MFDTLKKLLPKSWESGKNTLALLFVEDYNEVSRPGFVEEMGVYVGLRDNDTLKDYILKIPCCSYDGYESSVGEIILARSYGFEDISSCIPYCDIYLVCHHTGVIESALPLKQRAKFGQLYIKDHPVYDNDSIEHPSFIGIVGMTDTAILFEVGIDGSDDYYPQYYRSIINGQLPRRHSPQLLLSSNGYDI